MVLVVYEYRSIGVQEYRSGKGVATGIQPV